MKLTTKLLIITLLTMSFFMTEPKKTIQTNTFFTVTSKENSDYEQLDKDDIYKPRHLDTITIV